MLIWAHSRMKLLKLVSWVYQLVWMDLGDAWGLHPTFFRLQPCSTRPYFAVFGTMLFEREAKDTFIIAKRNINNAERTLLVLVTEWERYTSETRNKVQIQGSKRREWTLKW